MLEKQHSGVRRSGFISQTLTAIILGLVGGSVFSAIGQDRQLSLADILVALRSKKAVIEEKNRILAEAVKERGITFSLTPEIEKELGITGAYRELLDAIRQKTAPVEQVAALKTEVTQVGIPASKPSPAPLDSEFYRKRAATYQSSDEFDLAIADLGKAIELQPGDAQLYADRGMAFFMQNKVESAAADLDRSMEIDPGNSTALFNRALIWEKLGNAEKALALFDRAANADPANDKAKSQAARIRAALAEAEKKRLESAAPKIEPAPETRIIAVGALNAYAENIAIPVYPTIEKRMGIQGRVTVQISLDENGKVVSAQATEGPRSLRNAAVDAVGRSKFKPVKFQGKSVSASGFIVYNFVANQ